MALTNFPCCNVRGWCAEVCSLYIPQPQRLTDGQAVEPAFHLQKLFSHTLDSRKTLQSSEDQRIMALGAVVHHLVSQWIEANIVIGGVQKRGQKRGVAGGAPLMSPSSLVRVRELQPPIRFFFAVEEDYSRHSPATSNLRLRHLS